MAIENHNHTGNSDLDATHDALDEAEKKSTRCYHCSECWEECACDGGLGSPFE